MPYFLDGNNLMRRPGVTADRAALIAELADRLRRTRARAVVFFDGPSDGAPTALGALSLRFAGGVSADDAIVAAIGRSSAPSDVIVVTADRDLARRARDAGAKSLDPEAFWARFGTGPSPDDPKERVDVAEWMRYFEDDSNRR